LYETLEYISYENGYRRFHAVCLCHHQLIGSSNETADRLRMWNAPERLLLNGVDVPPVVNTPGLPPGRNIPVDGMIDGSAKPPFFPFATCYSPSKNRCP
jgi:hypothetical protein